MNLTIDAKLLSDFLPLLKELAPNKQAFVYFEQVAKNKLKIYASDHERFLSVTIPINLSDTISDSENKDIAFETLGFNASVLIDIVKKGQSNKPWNLNTTEQEVLMTQGTSKVKLIKTIDSQRAPGEIENTFDIILDTQWLKDSIRKVSFAMSQDDRRPILKGLLLKVKNNQIELVCSDNYRLALKTTELPKDSIKLLPEDGFEIVIPSKTITTFLHLLEQTDGIINLQGNQTKIEVKGIKFIHDKGNNSNNMEKIYLDERAESEILDSHNVIQWTFHSALVAGAFPAYEKIFKMDHNNSFTCNGSELYRVLDQVGIMAQDTHIVTLTLKEEFALISSTNVNIGEYKNECPGKMEKADEYRINFRIGFLMDLLKIFNRSDINMRITAPNRPMLIESLDLPGFKTIIVPLSGS